MSEKIVSVTLTVDTSAFDRRIRLLHAILEAMITAEKFEQAFRQYNAVVVEFEREIKALQGGAK